MPSSGLVAFGDSIGLIPVIETVRLNCIVYDPANKSMPGFCRDNGIKGVPHPDRETVAPFLKMLMGAGARLGIISSYSRILSREIIDFFPLGVVNLHLSRLPEYRGANTLQWTIINGETSTDATLHYVDEGIDTGPVIDRKGVFINETDTALMLRDKLLAAGGDLLRLWLPRLVHERVESTPQPETEARYWPRRTPKDGYVDLDWDARRIVDMTRALAAPWPGIWFSDSSGKTVTIDKPLSLEAVRRLQDEHGSKR